MTLNKQILEANLNHQFCRVVKIRNIRYKKLFHLFLDSRLFLKKYKNDRLGSFLLIKNMNEPANFYEIFFPHSRFKLKRTDKDKNMKK